MWFLEALVAIVAIFSVALYADRNGSEDFAILPALVGIACCVGLLIFSFARVSH